eukprot:365297-Chlamydomonas_euryale.AAC.11
MQGSVPLPYGGKRATPVWRVNSCEARASGLVILSLLSRSTGDEASRDAGRACQGLTGRAAYLGVEPGVDAVGTVVEGRGERARGGRWPPPHIRLPLARSPASASRSASRSAKQRPVHAAKSARLGRSCVYGWGGDLVAVKPGGSDREGGGG